MLYNASRRLGDTATAGEPAARGDIYMFTYTIHTVTHLPSPQTLRSSGLRDSTHSSPSVSRAREVSSPHTNQ